MRTVFATLEKCIPWVSKTMRKRKHTTKMCINVLQTIDFHTSKQGPEPNKVGIHWFPTLFRKDAYRPPPPPHHNLQPSS